ncbi:hypothetical protein [Stappia sp. MMSF_3263]|uniref:hypothetical protein n=1 Tax=Stappia sp. MMSF_3263 TaxID=3046693 RepID=UPI00273EAF62|nr:hypothetical protein [Stappia sp. MMSF_3263]
MCSGRGGGARVDHRFPAALLGLERGTPLFVFDRTTWLLDQPITHVRMLHPPGYRMVSRF